MKLRIIYSILLVAVLYTSCTDVTNSDNETINKVSKENIKEDSIDFISVSNRFPSDSNVLKLIVASDTFNIVEPYFYYKTQLPSDSILIKLFVDDKLEFDSLVYIRNDTLPRYIDLRFKEWKHSKDFFYNRIKRYQEFDTLDAIEKIAYLNACYFDLAQGEDTSEIVLNYEFGYRIIE
jgi:hypothetical protein